MTATMGLLDAFLAETRHQSLLDADAVRNFLLDLRSALAADELTRMAQEDGLDYV